MEKEDENHQKNLYRLLKYIVHTEILKLKIKPEQLKKGLFYIMGNSDSDFVGDTIMKIVALSDLVC